MLGFALTSSHTDSYSDGTNYLSGCHLLIRSINHTHGAHSYADGAIYGAFTCSVSYSRPLWHVNSRFLIRKTSLSTDSGLRRALWHFSSFTKGPVRIGTYLPNHRALGSWFHALSTAEVGLYQGQCQETKSWQFIFCFIFVKSLKGSCHCFFKEASECFPLWYRIRILLIYTQISAWLSGAIFSHKRQ